MAVLKRTMLKTDENNAYKEIYRPTQAKEFHKIIHSIAILSIQEINGGNKFSNFFHRHGFQFSLE